MRVDKLTLISVSLLVGAALIFAVLWIASGDPVGAVLSLVVIVLGVGLLLAVVGYLVSNARSWWRGVRGLSWQDHLLQMESSGKAVREHYQGLRALTFEDHTCGCLMHLVDIGENRILCLYGQHYYEFEPIDDDPEDNQPRKFPTTTFSLLRDTRRRDVLDLVPGSIVLEPVVCKPIAEQRQLGDLGVEFEDGQIIAGLTLDAAERALQART